MSYMSKFVAALAGLLVMTIVVSRQLFLFAVFRDPSFPGSQGGRYHLLLAAGAGLAGLVAGGLMFRFFLRHEKSRWTKIPLAPIGTLLNAISHSVKPPPVASLRGVLVNPWLSEGQADDRRPMDSSVADNGGPPSQQRTSARRSHQLMFKKWSQARHD